MFKYFFSSILVTILGLLGAYLWGEHVHSGTGLTCVFIAFVLAVLEISLSFDNAVVNAMKLEQMSEKWRHRFITWGILIAVFGMRFVFPLAVVAIFAKLDILTVLNMALNDVNQYAHYLELTHAPIVAFGGAFLLMLFLDYFTEGEKDLHWIHWLEVRLQKLNKIKGVCTLITLLVLGLLMQKIEPSMQMNVLKSGVAGILTYLAIDGLAEWLEKKQEERAKLCAETVKCSGLVGFLYLELIDASFSLDGVLGAFALSKDILIITIGLFIGAMFVRSLTIMLVEKKTLKQFCYLEHGAHWAIGTLAALMFVSTFAHVPEVVTGLLGLAFILSAFVCSLIKNKDICE
ncbi:MAG: DUF475 domain-containing protein [Cyanobacteria bacterium SIG28]|nr:DUF475 domain-containing protein [Cyanobacteria bacterium SIG28]